MRWRSDAMGLSRVDHRHTEGCRPAVEKDQGQQVGHIRWSNWPPKKPRETPSPRKTAASRKNRDKTQPNARQSPVGTQHCERWSLNKHCPPRRHQGSSHPGIAGGKTHSGVKLLAWATMPKARDTLTERPANPTKAHQRNQHWEGNMVRPRRARSQDSL